MRNAATHSNEQYYILIVGYYPDVHYPILPRYGAVMIPARRGQKTC